MRGIGLSEVGSKTTEKANAIHPLSLGEVEFSLWRTEIFTNGVAATTDPDQIPDGDIRKWFDRFQPEVKPVAAQKGVSASQLALAWVRAHPNSALAGTIIPILGSHTACRVGKNTAIVLLSDEEKAKLDGTVESANVQGGRYNNQLEDTLWN
ncbi:hypothetical protein LQW54_002045 [Pestalotiopsis sp. IQ-011]